MYVKHWHMHFASALKKCPIVDKFLHPTLKEFSSWPTVVYSCYISTSVYSNPTHTNQYLPFDSHHPVAHKASAVRTLMSRASELSLNGMVRVAEEERVVDALKWNGYPLRFIQRHSRCSNLPSGRGPEAYKD